MKLLVYSKGLYATWLYYSPDRLLFDCGEGASSYLGNKCFAIQRVFLSHGHTDHTAGLLTLVNIRNAGMGDTEKPLQIYYPEGNRPVELLKEYVTRTQRRLSYRLSWHPLEPGARVPAFEGQLDRHIEAFATQHGRDPSLGYNVVELRRRLKPDYQGLDEAELRERAKAGVALSEEYPQKLFSFGGDSVPIDPAKVEGTEVLCHDATFLDQADREEYKHATFKEAVQVALAAGVKRELMLIHVSSRYKRRLKGFEAEAAGWNLPFAVTVVPPGRIHRQD